MLFTSSMKKDRLSCDFKFILPLSHAFLQTFLIHRITILEMNEVSGTDDCGNCMLVVMNAWVNATLAGALVLKKFLSKRGNYKLVFDCQEIQFKLSSTSWGAYTHML
ncbi:uncharacterized protein PHALS_15162 [Plasmopara halstedii]|uniref:Uncharacterized protein n=1 Tax=Plasmopara halstedii TaxID=4781 RepID=A0A0P1B4V1_PLAHL|nr:uncharacterized protein PHALS_15162 [Plasmopara halstedii]CEG48650.1 hypothetical protein PHALS_15162 [Plasmopara halstedii]|eukprot:XP_024585019.1 hypothetical protein PHALS_15162 [Plasmopara halstedii]